MANSGQIIERNSEQDERQTRPGIADLVVGMLLLLVFFLVVTPVSLILQLTGRRPLPLGFDKAAGSYWIKRRSGRILPESFRRQS